MNQDNIHTLEMVLVYSQSWIRIIDGVLTDKGINTLHKNLADAESYLCQYVRGLKHPLPKDYFRSCGVPTEKLITKELYEQHQKLKLIL